jgi:large subunit ribosomal protein L23
MKSLIKPVISEKTIGQTKMLKYTFEANPKSNKIEIAKEVKDLYKVDPIKINIIKHRGKLRRRGRITGHTKNKTFVIITVKKGQKIPGFEIKE